MAHLGSFIRNETGNVSQIFALALVPIIVTVGMTTDYSRAARSETILQNAVDATAIMLAKEAPKANQSQLQKAGEAYLGAMMASQKDFAVDTVKVTKTTDAVRVSAAGTSKLFFGGLIGQKSWVVPANATVAYGGKKIELVLVLDNTGSMAASDKIGELRKASHSLLSTLEKVAVTSGQVKVSIVPYTTRVKLDTSYRDENWLTLSPTGWFVSDYVTPTSRAAWTGCVADRDTPANTGDVPYSAGTVSTHYPMTNCTDTVAAATPLTDNWAKLHASVDTMVAGGMTNITLGAQMGFEMLTNDKPFNQASGDPNVERFMVLLTDGYNTQDRWGWDVARMDANTKAVCDTITERGVTGAKKRNIKLYTVLVIDGNENLLKSCASDPSMYMKAASATDLQSVFKKIADEISNIRLTM